MKFRELAQLILDERGKNTTFVTDSYIEKAYMAYFEQRRGICLLGKVGSGKTFFFEVMNRFLAERKEPQFLWYEADDLETILRNEGKDALIKIAKSPQPILINDVGIERKTKIAPSGFILSNEEQEPFEIFMYHRHKFTDKNPNIRTHITTNLNSERVLMRYGDRIVSRWVEMFYTITYDEKQTDYRMLNANKK